MTDHLSNRDVLEAGLADWRKLAQRLHARFRVPDPGAGAAFVSDAVSVASEASLTEHLEMTLAAHHVDVRVATDLGGSGVWVTEDDVDLARRLSGRATARGLQPAPGEVTQVEMGLDTARRGEAAPFWAVVLTGSSDGVVEDTVFDPSNRVQSVWFQETEPHETPRQRWHPDVWVPPEVADERIAAAVAAGGSVVDDSQAPSFTVLADGEGNRVCVCTTLDRA
jgi:4a-hydroxytetrahydrobiopterin dehydratase